MEKMEIMKDGLDHNKWSRQIKAYGLEITKKISKLKILIIGMRGYGLEISKNIILSNPKQVSIFDNNISKINDLTSNFLITEEDVNNKKRRDEACLKGLCELNPSTKVIIENDYQSKINEFDIVIITEILPSEKINFINSICHENKKGFIYTLCLGLFGVVFLDFGERHFIIDKYGKENKKFYIKNITKEKNGKIIVDYSNTNERLKNKGYILLRDIEGMKELNNINPLQYYINKNEDEILIGDTSNYCDYINGGIIEEYQMPIEKNYKTFKNNFYEPNDHMVKIDHTPEKSGRKILLHILFISLQKYYDENNRLPDLNNEEEASLLLNKTEKIYDELKSQKNNKFFKNAPSFKKETIKGLIKFSKAQIPSMCSFLGGCVAQEALKYSGLYTPLEQWLWVDIYEETVINIQNANRKLKNCRYDDLIAIFGQEIVEKLHNSDIFLIGAGAVGCEYLKILSLMGVAINGNHKVYVADNDSIETSNLNRQFLFRKEHVGKSKSLIACKSIKSINPDFNCESFQLEVSPNTENIFNEHFWKTKDFILIAVDNVKARKYINNQCTMYGKKLIECGTLGVNASSQLIIPFITDEYNGFESIDKKLYELCTIKNFPYLIEHCIEWSRDKFTEYFFNNINYLKDFIENPQEFYQQKENDELYEILLSIKDYIKIFNSKSFDQCLYQGKKIFIQNYNWRIKEILKYNPPDDKCLDGSKFWKGNNRLPHIIDFNVDDDNMLNYVYYYSILLAECLHIPINNDLIYINNYLKQIKIKDTNETNEKEKFQKKKEIKEELLNIYNDSNLKEEKEKINVIEFEKDHDENHQIDFIYLSSIIRAKNFNIELCTRDKVKFIAGNIVPSIPTTTASIVGYISSQIISLLQTDDLQYLRQININLATPFFFICPPAEVTYTEDYYNETTKIFSKAIPPKFSCWDHLEINEKMNINQFIDYIKQKYKADIIAINTLNEIPLIDDNYELSIEDAYCKAIGVNNLNSEHIFFKVLADIINSEDHANMPKFKYTIKPQLNIL